MTPIELKSYFDQNPPPAAFELYPWAKIADTEKFLQSTYNTLANHKGNYEDCPAYWRLREFYLEIVKLSKAASPASGADR